MEMEKKQMEMTMGNGNGAAAEAQPQPQPQSQSHVLVFPFPVQGHMNPMVQFAKRLVSKGLKVTVVTTISAKHKFQAAPERLRSFGFDLELISDGSEFVHRPESMDESTERFTRVTTQTLADLITRIKNKSKSKKKNGTSTPHRDDHDDDASSSYPELKFLVYHSGMPWALDIARQHGIDGAPFFTNSSSVVAIYKHFLQGALKIPSENDRSTTTLSLPSMPPLGFADLPSFLRDVDSYPAYLELTLSQYSNIGTLKWLFICTFEKLEEEVVKWMINQEWPVRTIGPTVPSMFLDKRLEDDKEYSLSMFKPNVETCMEWLDSRESSSVVYASFGSLASLKKEQIEELAWGLRDMNYNFMWAVRESEMEKLPGNFLEETSEKGLVVSWCPQLQVLAHKAVRCFVTHCGWNSVLEALSFGVPMVTMPHWADQATNAKFVADVWKAGVRVKKNEKGIATKQEIAKCIKQVMEEDKGMKMRKASLRWKELAKEAVDEGGSSDKNIEEFVAEVELI
ncbi:mogroside IE synthase [Rosa sericea]